MYWVPTKILNLLVNKYVLGPNQNPKFISKQVTILMSSIL